MKTISNKTSLQYGVYSLIGNKSALIQEKVRRLTGDKPSIEPVLTKVLDAIKNH